MMRSDLKNKSIAVPGLHNTVEVYVDHYKNLIKHVAFPVYRTTSFHAIPAINPDYYSIIKSLRVE